MHVEVRASIHTHTHTHTQAQAKRSQIKSSEVTLLWQVRIIPVILLMKICGDEVDGDSGGSV